MVKQCSQLIHVYHLGFILNLYKCYKLIMIFRAWPSEQSAIDDQSVPMFHDDVTHKIHLAMGSTGHPCSTIRFKFDDCSSA